MSSQPEAQTTEQGVQVPITAVYAEHVDPMCPNFGETVRWPVDCVNGVFVRPRLSCATCFHGKTELRQVDMGDS